MGVFKTILEALLPVVIIFFRDKFCTRAYIIFNLMNYFPFAFPVCKPIFTTSGLIPYYVIPVNSIPGCLTGNSHSHQSLTWHIWHLKTLLRSVYKTWTPTFWPTRRSLSPNWGEGDQRRLSRVTGVLELLNRSTINRMLNDGYVWNLK